ncbi:MAG: hypothetical protein AB7R69_00980 [Candidatus Babeliales bacterium]
MIRILMYHAFLLLFLSIPYQACALFSFKDMANWMAGNKQETLHKEFSCPHECTLSVENHYGSIYIKSWALSKIMLQATKTAKDKDLDCVPFETEVTKDTISITTQLDAKKTKQALDYYIMVPEHVCLKLATKQGTIKVKNVPTSIHAKVHSGSIEIHDARGNLFLKNENGTIVVSMRELPATTHLMLEAHGALTLSLPLGANADISAKATNGTITSDHYVTFKPFTTKLNQQAWSAFKRDINAYIGKDGGAEIKLLATNGHIKILEY